MVKAFILTPIANLVHQTASLRIVVSRLLEVAHGKVVDFALSIQGNSSALDQCSENIGTLGSPRGLFAGRSSADRSNLKHGPTVEHFVDGPTLIIANLKEAQHHLHTE